MERVKLKDVCTLINGRAYKQDELLDRGKYPVLRVGNFFSDKEFYYSNLELDDNKYCDNGDLLFAWSASFGPKIWDGGKVIFHYHIWKMVLNEKIDRDYLYYYLNYLSERIKSEGHGGIMIHTTKAEMEEREILLPEITYQKEIVKRIDGISRIIEKRKMELNLLDKLIKARFVEMFGDPIINSEKLPTMSMTDVCEIIDGDRGKNYPTADEFSDEGYCLFLNAKNVTASGFNFDNCMFVSKEKDESLRKGKLSRGDVVLTTRGTLGNLAFYTDEIPFENVRINSGMVILRMKKEVIDEVYFIEQFKMQLDDIKEKIASGSAQPQLPISTMNKIQVLIPDIEKQKEFSEFIKRVDKSKFAA